MSEYIHSVFVIVIFVAGVFILYIIFQGNDSRSPNVIGKMTLMPIWPKNDQYLKKRGGLSTRESIGWLIVIILMFISVIIAIIFPAGARR